VISLNMDQTWLVSTSLSLHCTTWAIATYHWSVLGVCFRFNLRSAASGQFLIYTKTKLYGYGFITYDCSTKISFCVWICRLSYLFINKRFNGSKKLQ
jgi:hypothetical protein